MLAPSSGSFRRNDAARFIPALVGLVLMALGAFSPAVLNDGDTLLHIAAGRWIIEHGGLPQVDPFSAIEATGHWQMHEWLAEILLYFTYTSAGWAGATLATGLAAGMAGWLAAKFVLARVSPLYGGTMVVVGLALLMPSLLARPHVLVLPLLVMSAIGTIRAFDDKSAPDLRLALVFPFWANMHASFPVGLGLITILGAGTIWQTRSVALAWRWTLLFALSLLGCMVSPYGIHTLLFPFNHTANGGLVHVGEWAPTDFSTLNVLEISFGLVVVALAAGVRLPLAKILLIFGLGLMAIQHQRHWMLFGLIAPLLFATPAGKKWPGHVPPAHPAILLAGLALAILRLAIPLSLPDGPTAPFAALASVPQSLENRPVFNDYAFGGAMIFAGLHPAIDSRAELYGADGIARYNRSLTDRCALLSELSARDVRWAILAADNPAVAVFTYLPEWNRSYGDAFAVVFLRGQAISPPCP